MPSGYENSPDYGGKPPNLREALIGIAGLVVVFSLVYWSLPKPKECWTLGEDEITVTEVDGKQRATLDLRRIPKGECVTINTGQQIR